MARQTVAIGKSSRGGDVELAIEVRDTDKGKELSISADVWLRSRRDIEAGGQLCESLPQYISRYAEGWTPEKLARVIELWQRWHLNGMKPGCEHQRAAKWSERPIDPSKPLNAYGKHFEGQRSASWNMLSWVTREEHPEGLLSQPCDVCGYRYGSAWLHEELPAEVITELEALTGLKLV